MIGSSKPRLDSMSPRLRITAGILLLLATALPVVAGQFGRFFLPSPTRHLRL